jgi:hypothetical protein
MITRTPLETYGKDLVSEFTLLSATAFVAAIRGYNESTVGQLFSRCFEKGPKNPFGDRGDVDISAARTAEDLQLAADLVRHQYAARGYFADTEHPDQDMRHQSRRASTVLARDGRHVVGTLTVVIDSAGGLLADEINGDVVESMRNAGLRLSEVVRLAVSHQRDTDSRSVLAALFNAAHGLCVANRVDELLIEVNPRHVGFYRRALCFEVAGEEKICRRVSAPAVLLRMRLGDLTRKIGSLEQAIAEFPLGQGRH